MAYPLLYSFRRCPYAMRARMGLAAANIAVELREVKLSNKPAAMLALSPKGTVPVLQLADGTLLEESLDVLQWALEQNDPQQLLAVDAAQAQALIAENDGDFKHWLDRYKYADRHPEQTEEYYRQQGEQFLAKLEALLEQHEGVALLGTQSSWLDIAIFPFIRQFANVNQTWFDQSPYPNLVQWRARWAQSELFQSVMKKRVPWTERDEPEIESWQ